MTRPSWFCRFSMIAIAGMAMTLPLRAVDADHPAKPFLWKIEGKGLTKPSYLFGTIHVTTPAIEKLHPAAQKAFDSATELRTEIPLDSETQLSLAPKIVRHDGKALNDSIGKEMTESLNAELKIVNPQLDSKPFQTLKTWAITMSLPILKYQLEGRKAIDALLWQSATDAKKQTGGLETAESQFALLDSFNEDENIIILSETLKQLKEDRAAGSDSTEELISAYASGDEKKVDFEMNKGLKRIAESDHKELGERFMKKILADRNISMSVTIDGLLSKNPGKIQFFAVGTGHLVGDHNIRDYLTEKGYQITRIQD